LNGYITKGKYHTALLETNRGCPYKCRYCFWGGAVGTKVNKMGSERVREEITWLARNGFSLLYVIDANYGIFERDVEFAEHMAICRRDIGMPTAVGFSSAKNNPDRVRRIGEILRNADLLSAQPISLQTMEAAALEKIGRKNIKTSSYEQLQLDLMKLGISSYIELLWPLPGETLPSFKKGIGRLCQANAESIVVVSLMLMNNVDLRERVEEYGLVTQRSRDPNSEAEIVVQTNEVPFEECRDGWWFVYSMYLLYNVRGLLCLAHYLNQAGIRRFEALFSDFTDYVRRRQSAVTALYEKSFDLRSNPLLSTGRLIHEVCHERRPAVDSTIVEFAKSQPWWHDEKAQAFLEVDLLNRLYVYTNMEFKDKGYTFRQLDVLAVNDDGYVIQVPEGILPTLRGGLRIKAPFQASLIQIKHRQNQLRPSLERSSLRSRQSLENDWSYCASMMNCLREIVPSWEDYDGDQHHPG
jgi:hypothetical protein